MNTEPVRLTGYTALTVGLALLAIIGWSQGLDLRAIIGQISVVALTSVGGLEFARQRVTPVDDPHTGDGTPLVPAIRDDDGTVDLTVVLTVLLIVLVVVVLVRLL